MLSLWTGILEDHVTLGEPARIAPFRCFVLTITCMSFLVIAVAHTPPLLADPPAPVLVRASGNFSPDTWFAGPDPSLFGTSIEIPDWSVMPELSGTLLSCDSLTVLPAARTERRTFFEIYEDRLYVRSEGDTVHMNSWVLFHGGGSDPDSPYLVKVEAGDPALEDTTECAAAGTPWVVRPAGVNGSPIGFQHKHTVVLAGSSEVIPFPYGTLFPNFDPWSVSRDPVIGAYVPMLRSGKVYFVLRSLDSDGAADNRIVDPRALVEAVDSGNGTPEQVALRPKVMVFHVNYPPHLRYEEPSFSPQVNQVFPTRRLDLHLPGSDHDPFDPYGGPVGGPSSSEVLRWNVKLIGRNSGGHEVSVSPLPGPVFDPHITVDVPPQIAGPDVDVQVELCDCTHCEAQSGIGRCGYHTIPVTVPALVLDIETPHLAEFAIEGLRPNPADGGELTVHFSLPSDASASLELLDVTGRRQYLKDVGALGAGRHSIRLSPERRLAPGIYLVRLRQGGETRVARAAVIQ